MRNYLVVLLRTLKREKLYASINIAGLSLGIACALILGLFLRSELTYDRYNEHASQIYRLVNEFNINGKADRFAVTSRMVGPMMKADNPQILEYVRFQDNANQVGVVVRHGNDTYTWDRSFLVSPNVFQVFTHRLIYGDPKTALTQENTVAVSETFARKYFGNANPIGEIITTDAGVQNKITAVFADQPANTHLKYDILWSENTPILRDSENPTLRRQSLFGVGIYTYVLMAPGFDPSTWPRMSDEFFNRYMKDIAGSIKSTWRSWLQPLTAIHLDSEYEYDQPNGNRLYLYGCSAVALFILAVACINYMNLATARAMRRARSVGIRKILGATRLSLGLQFLGEAVLFSVIALVLGLVLVEVLLRFTPLNTLMGDEVLLNLRQQPSLLAWLAALGLAMGLLSGLYPAIYLSSWAPLSALTGKPVGGKGNLRLREVLVLTQFTISAAVIACTLLMAAQMRYIADKSLGFKRENQLVVTLRGTNTIDKLPSIRTELLKNAHVLGVAQTQVMLGQNTNVNVAQVENNQGTLDQTSIVNEPIGDDFVKVMGLRVLQGRDFSTKLLTDVGTNWLVNESLVRRMGWTQPLGKRIQFGAASGRVVGVVEDFNFKSLHYTIEPLAMFTLVNDFSGVPEIFRPFQRRFMIVSVSGDDVGGTLDYIGKVMSRVDPKHPFEYAFLDDSLDNLYKAEHRLTKLIGIFAAVCIFIACLGLFGLAAFTTEQRTREIGTRKVLGASTWQIIALLSRPIMILVLIASVLASVLAYFAMDEWLSGFAYRAGINPLIFLLAAIAAATIAFTTVALQSFKAASADPVDALRHVT
jgi:putative ABC transport system permease protein